MLKYCLVCLNSFYHNLTFDFLFDLGAQYLPPLAIELIAENVGRAGMGSLILVSKEWKENLSSALCTLQPRKDITDMILHHLIISFPNIKALQLGACKHLTGSFLLELGDGYMYFTFEDVIHNSYDLSLAKRQETLGNLGVLGSLEVLDLRGCQKFPPEALIQITEFRQLKNLCLQGQDVNEQLLLGIATNIRALEHLEVSDCSQHWGDDMSVALLLLLSYLLKLSFLDLSKNVLKGGALGLLYNWHKPVEFKLENTTCDGFLLPKTCVAFLNHACNPDYQRIALGSFGLDRYLAEEEFLAAGGIASLLNLVPFKAVKDTFQELALDILWNMVRNNISIQNAVLECDVPQKLLSILLADPIELQFESLTAAAAKLMLSLCGNNSVAGLAAVRDVGGGGFSLELYPWR